MKTDFDHLPEGKRAELAQVVKILFAEFEDALALATQGWKKQGRIVKIVLYGSHARGDWVADPVGGYFSDYDILIIVNDQRLTDRAEYWYRADEHLIREHAIAGRLSAEVNFIVATMAEVNADLRGGLPFFTDIVRDGVLLYDCGENDFAHPQKLTPSDALAMAQTHYDRWFESAGKRLDGARFHASRGNLNDAAFDYHQTTERLYICLLLTLTLYAPKSHNIKFLRGLAEGHCFDLTEVWPRDSKVTRRCFELLQQAYVNARYSPHYAIQPAELAWLDERITVLLGIVKSVCEGRLAQLSEAA